MEIICKKRFALLEKCLIIFSVLAVAILIFNTLSYTVTSEKKHDISLQNNWSITYNGDSLDSVDSLPYSVKNKAGDKIDVYTTLPPRTHDVEALSVTVYQKSVWIYIDGELIYEYEFVPKFLNQNPPGTGNVAVILPQDSAGKELHIEYRMENSVGKSFVMPPKIVDGAVRQTVLTGNNIIIFACMVSFLFIAILLFVMFLIKLHNANNSIANLSLALVFGSIATWILCYNRLTDIAINNWPLVHELEYLSIYVIPFAVWNYMECGWSVNSKIVKIMRNVMGLFYVGVLALRLFFGIDYFNVLTMFHGLILINIVLLIVEFATGFRKKKVSYKMFAVGIFIILLAAILGLIQQYFLKGQLYLSVIFTFMTTIAGVLMVISIFCLANENLSDKASNAFMRNLMYEHKRYEAIFQNTGDIFFDWDTKNDMAYVSSNFEPYFGVSPKTQNFGSFLKTGLEGLVLPDNFEKIIERLKREQKGEHLECRFRHADGTVKWFLMDLTMNLDYMGAQTHIIGIVQDITEKKRLEEVCSAQMQYNHIAKKMYDNVLEADLTENKMLSDAAKPLCRAVGIREDATYDETIAAISKKLTHPDYAQEYVEALSRERMLSLYEDGITNFELETYELDQEGVYQWLHLDVQIYRAEITNTIRILSYVNNISQEKQREMSLMEASLKDALTGILNKGALRVSSERFLENADSSKQYALFIIDIDCFKSVNDTYGHIIGDAAITHAANIIKSCFRESDFVGRFGGDEFVVLCTSPMAREDAARKCEALKRKTKVPFNVNDNTLRFTLSIGVSFCPKDGTDYKALCDNADKALYKSKSRGRDTYTIYNAGIS